MTAIIAVSQFIHEAELLMEVVSGLRWVARPLLYSDALAGNLHEGCGRWR